MNKKIDPTPFDRYKIPPRQNVFAMPFIWLYCWAITRSGKLKIHKTRMKGLKPPFIVFGTHHAFMDFYVTPLALFPYRANYISELEGFEFFGEWLYRQAGCLGTRKFVNDIALVKNIKRVIDRKDILVIYPEARYANIGTSSSLPESVGKLAKLLNVPIVTINMHGNYLQSPIWNLKKRKGVHLSAEISQLYTVDELKETTPETITAKLEEALSYDEYKWQLSHNMEISSNCLAQGLEHVIYQCSKCYKEFSMATNGAELFCNNCGSKWRITSLGQLELTAQIKDPTLLSDHPITFTHLPDWYEWQRNQVIQQINLGNYLLDTKVQIDSLPNAKNFIPLGDGKLHHDSGGFSLTCLEYGTKEEHTLHFPPISMFSVHTEYNYREKGVCITLSTLNNTYFIFPKEPGFNPTKIQFATEYLYQLAKEP